MRKPAAAAGWGPSDWGALLARLAAGAALAYSGLLKAAAPAEEFAVVVEAYYILPPGMVLPFARVVPWLELTAGLALASGYLTRAAAAGAAAMLSAFIGAILSTLWRGIPLENCGCFGQGVHLSPKQAVALDAVLLAMAVFALWKGKSPASLDGWVEKGT